MVSIEEYPFIFINTPASLQVLASAEMALMLWRRELANTSYGDALKVLRSEKKPRCKEVLDVPVPRRIRAQIDKKIASIGKELKEWMDFHLNRDLYKNSTEAFFNCFNHIVTDFSGSIGYKETAINILNLGEFNDAVNYKISCTFCLEDQVKRFWPAVADDPPIDANFSYDECNSRVSYWSSLMEVGNSITDTDLVKLQMMRAEAQTNRTPLYRGDVTAFEYFCKMLPDDARISKIISCLKCRYGGHAAARTLSTLDRVHAEKVFEQEASSILGILMRNDNYFQFVYQLWTLMGHLVLENESKFSDVVSELWKMAFEPDCENLTYTRCDQINDWLFEIWSNASDELKAHVSDTLLREYDTFGLFSSRCNFASCYGHDMSFVLEMMSKSAVVDKKLLWHKNWKSLALRSKPLYLEQFMLMCLSPNDYDIELFKHELANFEGLFESLIEEGFYSDLNDYLLLCSKDAEQFHMLGKKVLRPNLRFILIHEDDKFAKFDWFVGEVFANVQKDMDEFKSQMISCAAECLKILLAARRADKISSKDFSKIIRRFVNNEEELQLVKRKLFEHCPTYLVDYKCNMFNADQWQEFLEWCTGDHEEISTFKRSLNVDVIFVEHLRRYLNRKGSFGDLNFIDNFLNWYFGDEESAKNFKLQKIKNYKQIDILRVEMERRFIYTNGAMYRLLEWFFDDNGENVREFCESCNCTLYSPPRDNLVSRVFAPDTYLLGF